MSTPSLQLETLFTLDPQRRITALTLADESATDRRCRAILSEADALSCALRA